MSSHILKNLFETLGPSLLAIVNKSLRLGTVPVDLKDALAISSLKKPNHADLFNYRPISNLPFLKKLFIFGSDKKTPSMKRFSQVSEHFLVPSQLYYSC